MLHSLPAHIFLHKIYFDSALGNVSRHKHCHGTGSVPSGLRRGRLLGGDPADVRQRRSLKAKLFRPGLPHTVEPGAGLGT